MPVWDSQSRHCHTEVSRGAQYSRHAPSLPVYPDSTASSKAWQPQSLLFNPPPHAYYSRTANVKCVSSPEHGGGSPGLALPDKCLHCWTAESCSLFLAKFLSDPTNVAFLAALCSSDGIKSAPRLPSLQPGHYSVSVGGDKGRRHGAQVPTT